MDFFYYVSCSINQNIRIFTLKIIKKTMNVQKKEHLCAVYKRLNYSDIYICITCNPKSRTFSNCLRH